MCETAAGTISLNAGKPLRLLLIAGIAVTALGLAGCSSRLGQFKGSLSELGRDQTPPMAHQLDQLAQAYDARPGEKRASLAYGVALRARGQHAQAVAVLQQASIKNVGDREVAGAYGKALADVGRFEEAMKVLSQAHTADRPNWRILSTQGAVADQMGNHQRAREFYHQALQIAPNEPIVLTNLALSHVLTRDLAQAEQLLQRAASQPNADHRVQANLRLVQSLRQQASAAPQPAPRASGTTATQNRTGPTPRPAAAMSIRPRESVPAQQR